MTVWPSPDMDKWPATRVSALVFNFVVTACVVVHWVIQRSKFAAVHDEEATSHARYLRWGFWPCGRDAAFLSGDQLRVQKTRSTLFCCCFPFCDCSSTERGTLDATTTVSVRREPCSLWEIPSALLGGCVAGLWLHFWPCVVWT